MGAVNLGTWRIAILAALIAFGAVVLSNGLSGEADVDETPPPTTTGPTGATTGPTETETETPEPPPEGEVEGVTLAVFNATDEAGLAAQVTLDLEDAGYTIAQDAANAEASGVRRTTVYFRGGADAGQNRANAELLVEDNLSGAKVARLNPSFADLVPSNTQLVIVLGEDQIGA
jgi:hypothetical protein